MNRPRTLGKRFGAWVWQYSLALYREMRVSHPFSAHTLSDSYCLGRLALGRIDRPLIVSLLMCFTMLDGVLDGAKAESRFP